MIQELATRHQKKAALSLFFLFYMELVAPNINGLFAAPVIRFANEQIRSNRRSGLVKQPVRQHGIINLNPTPLESNSLVDLEKKSPQKKFASPNIGGPGQPEMSTFKSVNQNEMVDLFSGDFSYNI